MPMYLLELETKLVIPHFVLKIQPETPHSQQDYGTRNLFQLEIQLGITHFHLEMQNIQSKIVAGNALFNLENFSD